MCWYYVLLPKGPGAKRETGRCEKTTNHIQHIPSLISFRSNHRICLEICLAKLPTGNTPFVKTTWVPGTAAASWHLDTKVGDLDVTFLGTTIFVWKFSLQRSAIIMNHRSSIDLHKKYWGKEELTRSANFVRELFTKKAQNDSAPEIASGNFEV